MPIEFYVKQMLINKIIRFFLLIANVLTADWFVSFSHSFVMRIQIDSSIYCGKKMQYNSRQQEEKDNNPIVTHTHFNNRTAATKSYIYMY